MYEVLTGSSTATTENYICSVSDVCTYLNISTSDSVTGFINSCIGYVSDDFENYCNKVLANQNLFGIYDGDGTNSLILQSYPIVSINNVQTRGFLTDSWTDVTSDVDNSTGDWKILLQTKFFPAGYRTVKVNYNAGYTTIPRDIKKVAIESIGIILKESHAGGKVSDNRLGVTTRNIQGLVGQSISYNRFRNDVEKTLDYYRKVV